MSDVLDAPGPTDMAGRLPKNARAKALTVDAFKKVHKRGIDPRRVPVAIDIGCTRAYSTFGVDVSRTLCQSRAKTGGFWISTRGRKMSTNEILKVSGFKSDELQGWQEHVSKAQLQGMLGNCVPVPFGWLRASGRIVCSWFDFRGRRSSQSDCLAASGQVFAFFGHCEGLVACLTRTTWLGVVKFRFRAWDEK